MSAVAGAAINTGTEYRRKLSVLQKTAQYDSQCNDTHNLIANCTTPMC